MMLPSSVTLTLGFALLVVLLTVPVIGAGAYRRNLATVITGADPRFLRSTHDRVRFTSAGVLVVLTAVAAGTSLVSALSVVSGESSPTRLIPVGLVWASIVLSIDRWIVSTVDHGQIEDGERQHHPVVHAGAVTARFLIRLAMAAVIGLLISEPALLWIYRSEIAAQLGENHTNEIAAMTTEVDAETDRQVQNVTSDPDSAFALAQGAQATAAADEDTKRRIYICEGNPSAECIAQFPPGTITGERGDGPQTQQAYDLWQVALRQLESADANLAEVQASRDGTIATLQAEAATRIQTRSEQILDDDGLLARERALDDVIEGEPALAAQVWLIRAAIVLIDILPLLLATVSPRALYHRLERVEAIRQVRIAARDAAEAADAELAGHRGERARTLAEVAADTAEAEAGSRARRIAAEGLAAAAAWKTAQEAAARQAQVDPGEDVVGDGTDVADEVDDHAAAAGSGEPVSDDPAARRMVVGERWELQHPLPGASHSGKYPPYLARDIHGTVKHPVVVKIITDAPGRGDDRALRRALNEMAALPVGHVHPHLAEIVDADIDPVHGCFVVTPHYPMTLQSWVADRENAGRLTLLQVLTWTHQLLSGLDEAWRRGIVHLDVKPANIGLTDDLQIKLFDFGLMQRYRQPGIEHITTGHAKFTFFYAPPEQVRRDTPDWMARPADLYAVGATVYRMLTGRPPLWLEARATGLIGADGRPRSEQARTQLVTLVTNHSTEPLHRLLPRLPEPIADLVMRWLSWEPVDRNPGNPRGFTRRLLQQVESALRVVGANGSGGMLVGPLAVEPVTIDVNPRWQRQSPEDRPRRRRAPWTQPGPDETMPEDPVTYVNPDDGLPTDPATEGTPTEPEDGLGPASGTKEAE